MLRRIILTATLAIAVLHTAAAASDSVKAYTVKDVPNVHLLDSRRFVSDPDGILPSAACDTINAVCQRLNRGTGIETAVVVLPSIGEATPFDFSVELFRLWGIGHKKGNNGLLILFVRDQRRVRFTTGYGVEGDLPDAVAKRIQQRYMIPLFRQGDYGGGMVAGVRAVYNTLKDVRNTETKDTADGHSVFPYVFLVFAILLFCFLPTYLNRHGKRCPKCGRNTLRRVSGRSISDANGRICRRDTYVCDHCGHTEHKDHGGSDRGNGIDGMLLGMFLGSMMGGRRGGGGSFGGGGFGGGGSWGGGSTGGGGADSGW